ncbi:hypothetical protein COZ82_02395, partial [Candidatus Kaiserbacteria bacterium CG_4_8_14_3_um_filter_38_9]
MKKTNQKSPIYIVKRDGSIKEFQISKILRAVEKAMRATGETKKGAPEKISQSILDALINESEINT